MNRSGIRDWQIGRTLEQELSSDDTSKGKRLYYDQVVELLHYLRLDPDDWAELQDMLDALGPHSDRRFEADWLMEKVIEMIDYDERKKKQGRAA